MSSVWILILNDIFGIEIIDVYASEYLAQVAAVNWMKNESNDLWKQESETLWSCSRGLLSVTMYEVRGM